MTAASKPGLRLVEVDPAIRMNDAQPSARGRAVGGVIARPHDRFGGARHVQAHDVGDQRIDLDGDRIGFGA